MTVCIGALAAQSKAIVCIADRYLTYSNDVAGDTDSVKILPLGDSGVHAMISGRDDAIGRVIAKLLADESLGKDRESTRKCCEKAYQEAEQEILGMKYLSPFIATDDYKEALLKKRTNDVIKSISERIRKDREESPDPTFSCELALCGFDELEKPYLLILSDPGTCVDYTPNGFCAIGSGSAYALQRLLSIKWERKFPIDRAIYEAFDAKITAENDANVGYDSDVIILTSGKSTAMPEDVKTMLDRAWIKLNRSPYEPFNPDEHVPLPPDDWQPLLRKYAETIIPPESGEKA